SGDSGKTPGTDLREGVHTLPVLYALREDDAAAQRLRALLLDPQTGAARPVTDDAVVAEAIEVLNASSGMAAAHARLRAYADDAEAVLAQLPDGPAHTALSSLVRYTIDRTG
ncbi:MAG: polyprenyl synthetase family protein, partial [Actinomycetota bacterium]|nr:polyprenyl synthetase family protein [Actinomycetota bacterium]